MYNIPLLDFTAEVQMCMVKYQNDVKALIKSHAFEDDIRKPVNTDYKSVNFGNHYVCDSSSGKDPEDTALSYGEMELTDKLNILIQQKNDKLRGLADRFLMAMIG